MENIQLKQLDTVEELENILSFYSSMVNVSYDVFQTIQRLLCGVNDLPGGLMAEINKQEACYYSLSVLSERVSALSASLWNMSTGKG